MSNTTSLSINPDKLICLWKLLGTKLCKINVNNDIYRYF